MGTHVLHRPLLLASALVALLALRASRPAVAETPAWLYHWTSARGLERWADEMERAGEFVLKPLDAQSLFAAAYPQFSGVRGLFAWCNPATGIGCFLNGRKEWYARVPGEDPRPARLVVARLKPDLRVMELDTRVDYSASQPRLVSADPRGASLRPGDGTGLILHRVRDSHTGNVVLQEYVVLKRGCLSSLTASPAGVAPSLAAAIERQKDPRPYRPDELHTIPGSEVEGSNSPGLRALVARRMMETLSVPLEHTPPAFRNNACDEFRRRGPR